MKFLDLRIQGYNLLSGNGIEIGAFEHPAVLPDTCQVEYCDAISTKEARSLFPEISVDNFKQIDHIIDLNTDGLSKFQTESFDFVIMNHVIEHLVNPIQIIKEIYRVLNPGGKMVIAAPDKDYTFDLNRPLTPFDQLLEIFESDKKESDIYDYIDLAKYIHPRLMLLPQSELEAHLQTFKNRREHLSIWTAQTFKEFLTQSFSLLDLKTTNLYEVMSDTNRFEYFGVWEK